MTRVRPSRAEYLRGWRQANREHIREYKRAQPKQPKLPATMVGIDGEGLQVEGRHVYRYLAAWDDSTKLAEVENQDGITPEQAFEFLFEVKSKGDYQLNGFSLGYDYSKWFEGLPTPIIYTLCRPETRKGKHGSKPVRWGWYLLNYLRGRLTVTRLLPGQHRKQCEKETCPGCKHGNSVTVWDIWGFFQGSFIDACKNWKITNDAEYAALKAMKDKRSTFSEQDWQSVKEYCGDECRKLARLATALRDSHIEADLPLRSYYGAGSTASVLLRKMGVKACMPTEEKPKELQHAIACAFFGGRFEISRIGPIREPVYSYDIASAYPYQLYQLPCLACATWRHVTKGVDKAIEGAKQAIVRYTLTRSSGFKIKDNVCYNKRWGPFPLRTHAIPGLDDSCIVYPITSAGGWCYKAEYLAAREHWSNVKPLEAWILDSSCAHQPFAELPKVYAERLRWGKDGPGIVLKLGPNSCYGKIAQSIGDKPPYQCFEWAGMITSGCRAQLLSMMGQNLDSILMTATDGIVSLAPLKRPIPIDTGTFEVAKQYGKEALGAWEEKVIPQGIMLIRPGIAFPLVGEVKDTKARGIGKAVLTKHRQMVLDSWEAYGPKALSLESTIFRGMKSSTSYTAREGIKRAAEYGQWVPRVQTVSYMPEPKRPFSLDYEGWLNTWALRKYESAPYARILGSYEQPENAELAALKELQIMLAEQPDREDSFDEF